MNRILFLFLHYIGKWIAWSNYIHVLDHNSVYYYKDSSRQNSQFYLWNIELLFLSNFSLKANAIYVLNVKSYRLEDTKYPHQCKLCMFSIFLNKRSDEFLCYKHVSFFRYVYSQYRSEGRFNTDPQPEMWVTNLNNGFIYDECGYSFSFAINLQWTKSLNPIPNRNITPIFIFKWFQCSRSIT